MCSSFVRISFHLCKGSSCSLGVSFGSASVVLGVNPLVLISLFQVLGDIVSGLNEGIVGVLVSWVVVEVSLGD